MVGGGGCLQMGARGRGLHDGSFMTETHDNKHDNISDNNKLLMHVLIFQKDTHGGGETCNLWFLLLVLLQREKA